MYYLVLSTRVLRGASRALESEYLGLFGTGLDTRKSERCKHINQSVMNYRSKLILERLQTRFSQRLKIIQIELKYQIKKLGPMSCPGLIVASILTVLLVSLVNMKSN